MYTQSLISDLVNVRDGLASSEIIFLPPTRLLCIGSVPLTSSSSGRSLLRGVQRKKPNTSEPPKYTMTLVRRSARLSTSIRGAIYLSCSPRTFPLTRYIVYTNRVPASESRPDILGTAAEHNPTVELSRSPCHAQLRPPTGNLFLSHKHRVDLTEYLSPVTLYEIQKLVKQLPIKKSPGSDDMSNRLLKSLPSRLLLLLVAIFNAALSKALFPDSWKEAVVIGIP
ncbi:uncharacterized protein LOC131841751 [Achroia grisella]|uniref:uncharacterized protein LOC131841751 n=1 Tax=Achroia grisella TaxID=688607 RepID=UPI0027D2B56D|nr:uncharacterized protein LOC131841751 [Achroia grisella]XP_059046067.1 uncharacterized protein LOC131841751 [Achroia grisella]